MKKGLPTQTKRKRRSRKSNKGPRFEREFCKQLSLWWTHGESDAVFWRSDSSGARATSRTKRNKQTYGQYGDIQAVHPSGFPLIDLLTIELKRGYKGTSIQDLFDKPRDQNASEMESFIDQAIRQAKDAKTPGWMLVVRKDRRNAVVIFSQSKRLVALRSQLIMHGYHLARWMYKRHENGRRATVWMTTWESLQRVNPDCLKEHTIGFG
jgi:hypothetical protein